MFGAPWRAGDGKKLPCELALDPPAVPRPPGEGWCYLAYVKAGWREHGCGGGRDGRTHHPWGTPWFFVGSEVATDLPCDGAPGGAPVGIVSCGLALLDLLAGGYMKKKIRGEVRVEWKRM